MLELWSEGPPNTGRIRRCYLSLFDDAVGVRPEGWSRQVVSFIPHTAEILVEQGFRWHVDTYDSDLPREIETRKGVTVGIPNSDYSDNRVLRGSPLDLFDAYWETFDNGVKRPSICGTRFFGLHPASDA